MTKKKTFLDTPLWQEIVQNVKGIMTSDGTMATLMDFERVLDDANLYAYKNWKLGELVDGPVINRYSVAATFMWPASLMPDPRGGKRLTTVGCEIKFKKDTVKMPIEVKSQDDFKPGTHYPKMIDRDVWLVNIIIPKDLMNDLREGSIDIAGQNIDLDDLDEAYAKDYDTAEVKDGEEQAENVQGDMGGMGGMGAPMGDLAAPPM